MGLSWVRGCWLGLEVTILWTERCLPREIGLGSYGNKFGAKPLVGSIPVRVGVLQSKPASFLSPLPPCLCFIDWLSLHLPQHLPHASVHLKAPPTGQADTSPIPLNFAPSTIVNDTNLFSFLFPSLKKRFILNLFLHLCVWICACGCLGWPKRKLESQALVSCPTQMRGNNLWSSARTLSALNCWTGWITSFLVHYSHFRYLVIVNKQATTATKPNQGSRVHWTSWLPFHSQGHIIHSGQWNSNDIEREWSESLLSGTIWCLLPITGTTWKNDSSWPWVLRTYSEKFPDNWKWANNTIKKYFFFFLSCY